MSGELTVLSFDLTDNRNPTQPDCLVCQINGPPGGEYMCHVCNVPVHPTSGCSMNRDGDGDLIMGDPFRLCFTCGNGNDMIFSTHIIVTSSLD